MKEKRHLVMWVEVIALANAAGKAGNCENPGECKEVQEYTCAGREQERCAEGERKKRGKKLSVTK